jgi:flagellar basal-body rod modification protein FlgD
MAAAAAGIFNHQMAAAAAALKGQSATAADSTTSTNGADGSGSDDGSGDSATISANDFLTLLVTEMQNQDPTADTDPNEYIDQLVQVNSLEQLIDINQTLSTDLGGPTSTTSGGDAAGQPTAGTANAGSSAADVASATHAEAHKVSASALAQMGNVASGLNATGSSPQKSALNPAPRAPGNLAVPSVNRAAQRVGHALDGRVRARPIGKDGSAAQ